MEDIEPAKIPTPLCSNRKWCENNCIGHKRENRKQTRPQLVLYSSIQKRAPHKHIETTLPLILLSSTQLSTIRNTHDINPSSTKSSSWPTTVKIRVWWSEITVKNKYNKRPYSIINVFLGLGLKEQTSCGQLRLYFPNLSLLSIKHEIFI